MALLLIVQGAAAGHRYVDPAGDATGGAPDVTSAVVANDRQGTLTVDVTAAGLPAADSFLLLPMNTDGNAATGDDGVDYVFQLIGATGLTVLYRWNGLDYIPYRPPSASGSYADGTVHFEVAELDIGSPSRIAFWVLGVNMHDDSIGFDEAPNGSGQYHYVLRETTAPPPPPLRLWASRPAGLTSVARAHSPFTVWMDVTRSDGKPFTGAVACKAKAGALILPAAGRAIAGTARCTVHLPKVAGGKTLSGSIAATAGTARVSRSYTFPIH